MGIGQEQKVKVLIHRWRVCWDDTFLDIFLDDIDISLFIGYPLFMYSGARVEAGDIFETS